VAVRTVEGPGSSPQKQNVTSKEAAEFMGCAKDLFEELVEKYASDWLRPLWLGGKKCWVWEEVQAFVVYYRCLQRVSGAGAPPDRAGGGKEEGEAGKRKEK
jgi:hypothetical protein